MQKQKIKCAILGATGRVGREAAKILSHHPEIKIIIVAGSQKTAGTKFKTAIEGRMQEGIEGISNKILNLTVQNVNDVKKIASQVDFVFCALDLPKDEIIALEEAYAKEEVVVVSNNSACRWIDDVPMIIPEINGVSHLKILETQRKRLGTKYGCIVVKPNCAVQSFAHLLHALEDFQPYNISVVLLQSISGTGKYLFQVPEIHGNIISLLDEAEKNKKEPTKIFGKIKNEKIIAKKSLHITATSVRVPVESGHTAVLSFKLRKKIARYTIGECFTNYNPLEKYKLHSCTYFPISYQKDAPSPQKDCIRHNGMKIVCGELKQDFDSRIYQLTALSHNLIRGAAGGAILTAELMIRLGIIKNKS